LEKIPSSIGQLNALEKLDLLGCSHLEELPSSIGQLNAFQKLVFSGCSHLEKTTFIYWSIECTPKALFEQML
jgi:Leucine-rich repeat (LRR) protein